MVSLHNPPRIETMARNARLSVAHFRRLFLQASGLPPKAYIKQLQLSRASELLLTTHLSVKEVMAQVGHNDLSHFVRDFRNTLEPRLRRSEALVAPRRGHERLGQ